MRYFNYFKRFCRIPAVFFLIFLFVFSGTAGGFIFSFRKRKKIQFYTQNTSFFSRLIIKALNIKIRTVPYFFIPHELEQKKFFIISNHLSYLDIPVISSFFHSLFISSIEIKKTFFLGKIAKTGGSVFVERRSLKTIQSDIEKISKLLNSGFNTVLFPEGTTSNGEKVLPFKKSLFETAGDQTEILPICIQYIEINKEKINDKNKNLVYWYGKMPFFRHFLNLMLKTDEILLELRLLPVLKVEREGFDRKNICEKIYETISRSYLN
ncbi:MAG TPA: hypothetical protein DHW82_08560 [Spirochaetia bacterium]|nr:MAG: hypothetical protein A2Y41_04925 [Spirochaetes bacterium GWB1_36_13]HCL57041.1 hypothetical protein [Spirochaetia bacterium]